MKYLIHILFVLFASLVIALPMSAKEQYVDPVFGDTIDRSAEDFVKVSLVIADPGALFSSVLGHACLRMQCPVFGLDACYSYESEDISDRVLDFLMGKIRMGLYEVPTADYCAYYEEAGRGVREYQLNLPPHAVARKLLKCWQINIQSYLSTKRTHPSLSLTRSAKKMLSVWPQFCTSGMVWKQL